MFRFKRVERHASGSVLQQQELAQAQQQRLQEARGWRLLTRGFKPRQTRSYRS